jgi:hypothetical protein
MLFTRCRCESDIYAHLGASKTCAIERLAGRIVGGPAGRHLRRPKAKE